MTGLDDIELLRQYAGENSEPAFAALVGRHVNFVYSNALRRTSNPHAAEEITQAVFIILARKAKSFSRQAILTGWLHQTTRLTAANFLRTEIRRQHRESEAFMQSVLNETDSEAWTQIAPLLDDAISKLGERDRNAILLRYFENKSAREMAAALRVDEPAAQKRVTRAVEKLRAFFAKRGVTLTAAAIAGAVSANSVQAAPVGLAATVTAAAAKGAAVSASTLTLIEGALKIMAWTKAKMAVAVGVGVLLAAGTTTVVVKEFIPLNVDEKWFETNGDALAKVPDNLEIIRPTHFGKPGMGSSMRGMDERIVCQNYELEWGLVFADNFSGNWPTRVELPEDFPKERFDYLITLPHNQNDFSQDKVKSILRDLIKKQFGFAAHRETRARDVFLLQVKNPNAVGLQKSAQGDEFSGGAIQSSVEGLNSKNFPIYALAEELENHLQIPVLDQTGLTNRIALDLRWKKLPGETVLETTKRVVLDQLGLELVPTNMPIEMLVVEKVKN
jgi:uncharacterized protein (TIGR03435 family)